MTSEGFSQKGRTGCPHEQPVLVSSTGPSAVHVFTESSGSCWPPDRLEVQSGLASIRDVYTLASSDGRRAARLTHGGPCTDRGEEPSPLARNLGSHVKVPAEWSALSAADERLYQQMFSRSTDSVAYENNWAFLVQEGRFGAYRYWVDDLLLSAVRRHPASPYIFIFPPLGSLAGFAERAASIAQELSVSTGLTVVFRKIRRPTVDDMLQSGSFVVVDPLRYKHSRDLPEDVFPQVVISVDETLAANSARFVKTRNQVRFFRTRFCWDLTDLEGSDQAGIDALVRRWSLAREAAMNPQRPADEKAIMAVDTSAYTVFAASFGETRNRDTYFAKVLRVDDVIIGFTFAGRVSAVGAALYCCMTLRAYRGATEFLLRGLLEDLSRSGIHLLNMGGSETKGLYAFKMKQSLVELRDAMDVEYAPRPGWP